LFEWENQVGTAVFEAAGGFFFKRLRQLLEKASFPAL
jgi:hypothetical protein